MSQDVILFIDWQNMYKGARLAFFDETLSHIYGQFDPVALGQLLCARSPFGENQKTKRNLKEVRVYTGLPNSSKDPKSYGARRSQISSWKNKGANVIWRTLRYPHEWPDLPPREKGIDVALAIDFVTLAIDESYDVGIIASTDTDLRPALEYVIKLGAMTAEVAAWRGKNKSSLSVPGEHVWCHRLYHDDYDRVADLTHYTPLPKDDAGS